MDLPRDMTGLQLLLAVGDTVEKVHQSVWYALLKHSDFLQALGRTSESTYEVHWEPAGKLFDLKAETPDNKVVWIELKVDSVLSEDQIRRQLEYCGPGHEVLHVLLGFSERRFRRLAEAIGNEVGGVVLGTTEVLEALRKLAAQPGAATAIGQLAAAYADQIVDMQHRR